MGPGSVGFSPQPTPFINPSQGGNQYVPQGQLGNPISQNALPLPMTPAQGGTNWIHNTYGYSNTPNYSVSPSTIQSSIPSSVPNPTPVPTPKPSGNSFPDYKSYNVGDQITGPDGLKYRSNGTGWELLNGQGNQNGPSQADVEGAYAPALADVNQMAQDWQGNQQNYINQFTQPYQALIPGLQSARDVGLNQVATQQAGVNTQAQNAIDAAKSLYNQTNQGVNQRFGGTSSAGDFAKAFYNRNFNQQLGGINNTQGQNTQALNTRAQDVQTQYSSGLQTIQAQTAAAQAQANSDFQNKLQQINSLKATLDTDKAQMKISELQNYRSLIASINDQAANRQEKLQESVLGTAGQLANSGSMLAAYGKTPVPVSDQLQAVFQAIGGNPAQQGGGQYGTNNMYGSYVPPNNQNQYGLNTATGGFNPYQQRQQ